MTHHTHTSKSRRARSPLIVDVTLGEWGARGATRVQVDGSPVLVDRGIPGERVTAQIDRGRRPRRGVVEQVLEASSDRVAPPCPYYGANCGGCQWQHLAYDAQIQSKVQHVDRQLEEAGVRSRVCTIHPMQDPWHYRRTAALALGWESGFRPRARRGIVEIHDCLICHPLIGNLSHHLNRLLDDDRLPCYHGKLWLDCTVVGTDAAPRLQIVLQGIPGLTPESHPELPDVAWTIAELDNVVSVSFRHRTGEVLPLVGDLLSLIEVGGRLINVPAGSFFQTNLVMLPLVSDRIAQVLKRPSCRAAADVYGGVGTFGVPLSSLVEHMYLIELDAAAVQAARLTAADWDMENITFIDRHAERALRDLPHLDAIIVDPPRSGLGEGVGDAILSHAPTVIVYVSCEPHSLARDLAQLESGGYHVSTLELFDFYPQTYHVESLAILER